MSVMQAQRALLCRGLEQMHLDLEPPAVEQLLQFAEAEDSGSGKSGAN